MFGKVRKKLDRRMRRRIRKTSAVMLLISAITVAAIPVPEAAAAPVGYATGPIEGTKPDFDTTPPTGSSIVFDEDPSNTYHRTSSIPVLDVNNKPVIYSSRDNIYQFAYMDIPEQGNRAILLGAQADAIAMGGRVDVPEVVEAYVQYTRTLGSTNGFAAANQAGNWVYYKTIAKETVVRSGTWTADTAGNKTYSWDKITPSPSPSKEVEAGQMFYPNISSVNEIPNDAANPTSGTMSQTLEYYRYDFKVCFMTSRDDWAGDNVTTYVLKDYTQSDYSKYENYEYYLIPTTLTAANAADFGLDYTTLTEHDPNDFIKTTTDTAWLRKVDVGCISSQRAKMVDQKWELAKDTDQEAKRNFFTNAASITSISLPPKLYAVAPKTFSSCTNLNAITFTEKIQEIGASAFENCTRLETVNMPYNAGITEIAENTFLNCQSLKSFSFPTSVTKVGNSAFSGCRGLSEVLFSDTPETADKVLVEKLGLSVFKDCTALTDIVLPESLTDMGYGTFEGCTALAHVTLPARNELTPLRYSAFKGCTGLKWIDILNNSTTFETSGPSEADRYPYDVDQFKADVGEEFFFRGEGLNSKIHDIISDHEIAFQYRGSENYEKIVRDEDYDTNNVKYTYLVSKDGQLLGIDISGDIDKIESVVITSQVGPHKITSVGSEFSNGGQGNDNLKAITIPKTITTIGKDAFKGCKNLEKVIFEEPNQITSIGEDAFFTQFNAGDNPGYKGLTFYGRIDIESEPFKYAMDKNHNINNES